MYKKVIFVLVLCAGALGVYAYRASLQPVVLLQVGPFVCTASCFAQALTDKLRGVDSLTARQDNVLQVLKHQVEQDFIVQSLVTDWAQRHALLVKDDEITQRINEVRQQYPNDLQLKEVLVERGLNFQKWRHKIKNSLLEKKVMAHIHKDIKLQHSDEELKQYYEQHLDEFKLKAQVKLSQVILPSMGRAEHLRQEIKKGKSFQSLAPQVGGVQDVGWVERGSFDIFDQAFEHPVGWLSEVQQSQHGFHVIKLEGRRPARQLSFEAVKPRIEALYRAQAQEKNYKKWLKARLKQLKVYKNEGLIEALRVENTY